MKVVNIYLEDNEYKRLWAQKNKEKLKRKLKKLSWQNFLLEKYK